MCFLVQDFLDYAQIKSGNFRINIRLFNVREVVEQVMCIQRQKAIDLGIEFKAVFVNFAEAEGLHSRRGSFNGLRKTFSPMLYSDHQRIMQVLLNLQSNALKFTKSGSVTIEVEIEEAQEVEEVKQFLRVSVVDTGVGIPWKDQDKLFKLFGFVESTQEFNQNGIGLGLVISEKIVKKFGGKIEFDSIPRPDPNHGTRFSFTIELQSESQFEVTQRLQQEVRKGFCANSTSLFYVWEPLPAFRLHEELIRASREAGSS